MRDSSPQIEKKNVSGSGMRIVIAGGGTGGHLFPGVAIAEAFKRRSMDNQVIFMTTGRPIETRVLFQTGYQTVRIAAAGVKGKGSGEKLKALVKVPAGIFASLALFIRFRPHVVIGMGGYSAAPVLVAAWMFGIFRVIHEQNRIPGMTNRFLARYAHRIYVSFEDTDMGGPPAKVRFTGNPIRLAIVEQMEHQEPAGLQETFTILILGGSQGAHAINLAVLESLAFLAASREYRFIHQTGLADADKVRQGYEQAGIIADVAAFFDDMAACYKAADLIVCRAGATSVAEAAAAGLPAIFIPYPYAADNHQYFNAKIFVDAGAGEMIEERALDGATLAERINYYADHVLARQQMGAKMLSFSRPQAAAVVVEDICCSLNQRRINKKRGLRALPIA